MNNKNLKVLLFFFYLTILLLPLLPLINLQQVQSLPLKDGVPPAPLPTPTVILHQKWDQICYNVTFNGDSSVVVRNISLYQGAKLIGSHNYSDMIPRTEFNGCFSLSLFTFFCANFSVQVFQQRWDLSIRRVDSIGIFICSPVYLIFISIAIGVSIVGIVLYILRKKGYF